MKKITEGMLLASAVASLFASNVVAAQSPSKEGVTVAKSSVSEQCNAKKKDKCKGPNGCKGKTWIIAGQG